MDFFSPVHLIIIAVVGIVLFVAVKRLPEMARSIGRSLRIFSTEVGALGDDPTQTGAGQEPTPTSNHHS